MGVGKTYWAKKLSESTQIAHIDLDVYIEETHKMSVKQLFISKGEASFRLIESQCLTEIINQHSQIIVSCGGGTPCFHKNMKLMKEAGLVVYLKVHSIDDCIYLKANDSTRPLTQTKHFKDDMNALLKLRAPFYEQSDKIIEVNKLNESNFAKKILE